MTTREVIARAVFVHLTVTYTPATVEQAEREYAAMSDEHRGVYLDCAAAVLTAMATPDDDAGMTAEAWVMG